MMPKQIIVGVMGAGDAASANDLDNAQQLGTGIAKRGWALLTGGRDCGVMAAASKAAFKSGGLTIGLLPGESFMGASPDLVVGLPTGLGSGRNQLNVLASQAVAVCADNLGPGTLSELALALKAGKPTFVVGANQVWQAALAQLRPQPQQVTDAAACLAALDSLFERI